MKAGHMTAEQVLNRGRQTVLAVYYTGSAAAILLTVLLLTGFLTAVAVEVGIDTPALPAAAAPVALSLLLLATVVAVMSVEGGLNRIVLNRYVLPKLAGGAGLSLTPGQVEDLLGDRSYRQKFPVMWDVRADQPDRSAYSWVGRHHWRVLHAAVVHAAAGRGVDEKLMQDLIDGFPEYTGSLEDLLAAAADEGYQEIIRTLRTASTIPALEGRPKSGIVTETIRAMIGCGQEKRELLQQALLYQINCTGDLDEAAGSEIRRLVDGMDGAQLEAAQILSKSWGGPGLDLVAVAAGS